MNLKFHVYQIFYDQKSRAMLDPGFIPLDNSSNLRPDWYEFHIIRSFLNSNHLKDNEWYGFLSPKFYLKTNLTSNNIYEFLTCADNEGHNSALISHGWDQIAFYKNSFEQGDKEHPGLLFSTSEFLRSIDITLDLTQLVGHSLNTVYSNFIIAKPIFWHKWLSLSNAFYSYAEKDQGGPANGISSSVSYEGKQAPLKTFIQERFANLILLDKEINPCNLNLSAQAPIHQKIFFEDIYLRGLLQTCDLLKQKFTATLDIAYLNTYFKIRTLINTKY